jgi:hypothetical protein
VTRGSFSLVPAVGQKTFAIGRKQNILSVMVYSTRAGMGVLTSKTPCGLAGQLNHLVSPK